MVFNDFVLIRGLAIGSHVTKHLLHTCQHSLQSFATVFGTLSDRFGRNSFCNTYNRICRVYVEDIESVRDSHILINQKMQQQYYTYIRRHSNRGFQEYVWESAKLRHINKAILKGTRVYTTT